MELVKVRKINERNNIKRLYMDFAELAEFGFDVHQRYTRQITDTQITLTLDETGQYTVSRKKRKNSEIPLIDLYGKSLNEVFAGFTAVQIHFQNERIIIAASEIDQRIQSREARLTQAIASGLKLKVASMYHGAGIFDNALHAGLQDGGMASETNVVIEREQAYLRISRRVNQNFAQNVSFFESPAELVSSTQLSARTADLALLSIPCTGHSRSGKSKNKIAMGEAHADAGAQVFYAIDFIQRLNPAIVQIENVPDYIGSASYEILTGVLTHMGYVVQTRVFAGRDFGALENRKRMIMLALSKGIAESTQFDLSSVSGRKTVPATVGAIVDRSAGGYATRPGLVNKQARDKAEGKGFSLQWINVDEAKTLGTAGRGYGKARGTEPFFIHPDDTGKVATEPEAVRVRIMTPAEHARVKTIPESFVLSDVANTTMHEALGQSGVWEWFFCLNRDLARTLKAAGTISGPKLRIGRERKQFELAM